MGEASGVHSSVAILEGKPLYREAKRTWEGGSGWRALVEDDFLGEKRSLFGDPQRCTVAALFKLPESGFLICKVIESTLGSSVIPVIVRLCVSVWT